ncbi:azurin [Pelobium manganitolerans]|uniref:Azurin n=1 Tax=Pelobium manganitolerans TaxID=1842495 RepID=A0A419S786_9SPHI|nr:azurin [Pelobium manganitolerans]RKD17016.1 azurin [Pelobium manganitolerans]
MKKISLKSSLLLLALGSSMFFACNNDQKTESNNDTVAVEEEVADDTAAATNQDKVEITLNGSDAMQFDKSEIKVAAGQTVVLTLHHTGKLPVESMGHNFVLLKQGTDVEDFATKAMAAKDNGYIPTDDSNIIAHTKLIGGGESDTITFTAPEKGTYDFLCSFPGHHAMMKGKFIVE